LDITSDEFDLSSEEPEHKSDGLLNLVVGRDSNINEFHGRVGITESDNGDVHVGGLSESLVINSRVTNDQESRLDELFGDLIGKHTGSPFTTNISSTSVGCELEDSSLSVDLGGSDQNILGVADGSDDSSSNHELFPGLGDVEIVAAVLVSSVDVVLHLLGAVGGTNVDLRGKHEGEIFLSRFRVGEAVR
jgi:hypothetical protein